MVEKVIVDIKNISGFESPKYSTDGSGCADVVSNEDGFINPGEFKSFSTGLYFEIPEGYVIKVYSRSGMGFKNGISLINSVGIIDSDYRGEMKVSLINNGNERYYVAAGDKIAQISLEKIPHIVWRERWELSTTKRGIGGFGSTGK